MKTIAKKITSVVLLLSLLLLSVGAFSGCSMFEDPEEDPVVSVTNTSINAMGELIVYYSDGTQKNLGKVVGKDGEDGKDGDDVRIVSADINENGELVLTYSDNTTENLGVVVGKDGENAGGSSAGDHYDVNLEITGDAESAAATVAAAAPSVVSVRCSFSGGLFGGSSGSSGSGVFYTLDKTTGNALIITNYHVVYDADLGKIADSISINVYGSPLSSQAIPATFVGGSMMEDIAVLRVQGSERLKNSIAKAAELASSDALHPGDTAIAIGNPRGMGISATYGKVNVITEGLDTTACDDVTSITLRVIRIDTAVNGGNSGGGLFDAEGKLIGIVNAKIIEENIENIGFALPINKVKSLVDNIVYYCLNSEYITPYKPTFGIEVQIVDSQGIVNTDTGLIDIVETIEVIGVEEGSISEGIYQVGDRVLSVRVGTKTVEVKRMHNLVDSGLDLRPGETVYVTVLRDGYETVLAITPPTTAYKPC